MDTSNQTNAYQHNARESNSRFWEIGDYGLVQNELLSFLRLALNTERLPFNIHHAGVPKHASTKAVTIHASYSLDYYYHVMPDLMSIVIPGYEYSPLLELFKSSFQQHRWLRYCSFRNPNSLLAAVPMLEAEVFNDFVGMLRTLARQQNTWRHVQKWKSETERHQAESIKKYVPRLLTGGGYLEPIRLDFQYLQNSPSLSDAMPYGLWIFTETDQWAYLTAQADGPSDSPESRARVDTRVAMQDRARFFANIYRDTDRQTFRYMRGYIIKMERGENGAIHFHCCFFLDARRPVRLTTAAVIEVISSRWARTTQGRGLVFSCHSASYQQTLRMQGRWALDPLGGHNQHQVKRLTDYLLSYFARDKDQSIHVKPTARSRALTMAIGRPATIPTSAAKEVCRLAEL